MSNSTRYANSVISLSDTFLWNFGLSKPEKVYGDNKPRVFPYGVEGVKLYEHFKMMLDSYEHYQEFVTHYKDLIHSIEDKIDYLKGEINWLTFNGDPLFERRDLQSTKDILGNVATKLYYLRTNARTWRREVNALLHDEEAVA